MIISCGGEDSEEETQLEGVWYGIYPTYEQINNHEVNEDVPTEKVFLIFNGTKIKIIQELSTCEDTYGGYYQKQNVIKHTADFTINENSGAITFTNHKININDEDVTGKNGTYCFRFKTYPKKDYKFESEYLLSGNTFQIRTDRYLDETNGIDKGTLNLYNSIKLGLVFASVEPVPEIEYNYILALKDIFREVISTYPAGSSERSTLEEGLNSPELDEGNPSTNPTLFEDAVYTWFQNNYSRIDPIIDTYHLRAEGEILSIHTKVATFELKYEKESECVECP